MFLHTLSLKATPKRLQLVNYTEPFTNTNGQIGLTRGSQLAPHRSCSAPCLGKVPVPGDGCREITACSRPSRSPSPPVLLLLLSHLHLFSSTFSQAGGGCSRRNTALLWDCGRWSQPWVERSGGRLQMWQLRRINYSWKLNLNGRFWFLQNRQSPGCTLAIPG